MLRAEAVSVTIDTREILSGVDLSVGPAEVVAILGPSGVGKTTLLSCLGGLRRPTSGSIWANGEELSAMRSGRRSRFRLANIGFVFQHADLLPELTPTQNVMLPALLAGTDADLARNNAEGLMANLGIMTSADTGELSGGEAQRLALARALITDPSLLLADEPTGSLDEETRDEVLDLMLRTVRERAMGAVVVTHDRGVAAWADRTVVLPMNSAVA
jgi:ABC-type lipoprotein export system ATPase subunit